MARTKPPKKCFVIMPFSRERKEVYTYGIAPACENSGYAAVRVDELKGHFNINRKIIEHIFESDAVVAEITDKNPNVFYEMGVAHAIGNKTIMIAQNAEALPFDIRNYRCLIYEQSVEGLQRLQKEIAESLQEIDRWSRQPSNPVQDFKPHNAFVSQSSFSQLQKESQRKDELLLASKAECEALQKQIQETEKRLANVVDKSQLTALQNDLAQARAEKVALEKELQRLRTEIEGKKSIALPLATASRTQLRSQPLPEFSVDDVNEMLKEKNFFAANYNKQGKGIQHQYETAEQHGEKLVIDHATGLMWQQSGSPEYMNYSNAENYIRDLNKNSFAGCNDWRLPTLEEAMSLMEPKKHDDLYLDPVFDSKQQWIWTADKFSASAAWVVYFGYGDCGYPRVGNSTLTSVPFVADNRIFDHLSYLIIFFCFCRERSERRKTF